MPEYDSDADATGKYVVAFVENAGEVSAVFERKTRRLVEKHVGELDPDGWYKVGDFSDALHEIEDEVGHRTMEQAGRVGVRELEIPDDATLQEAYEHLNAIHTSEDVHRNSEMDAPAGQYTHDLNDDRSAHVGMSQAYPYTKSWAKGVHKELITLYGPEDASPTFEKTTARPDELAAWTVEW
jgi:hypothetical protein